MSRKIKLPEKLNQFSSLKFVLSKLAIIFPWKEPKSQNKAMADISIEYYTSYCRKKQVYCWRQWATEVLRHLAVKFNFRASWTHSPSPQTMLNFLFLRLHRPQPPPQTMLNFLFRRLHRPQHLHNIGGTRELTFNTNVMEQVLKYRKVLFPKCLNYFCLPLSGVYLCKLWWFQLYIQPLAS